MKIHILCEGQGSSIGVVPSDIYGQNGRVGVGGSEYALLTVCEGLAKRGDDVVLYNNPRLPSETFEQRNINSFDKLEDRDVLIVFREPSSKVVQANGLKVFWSCDQWTTGDFGHFSGYVDKILTISPYHTKFMHKRYGIEAFDIDLPVRLEDYANNAEKVSNRIIFTSVPDRGLDATAMIFSSIKKRVPSASLVITSDYRLWGSSSPGNSQHMQRFLSASDVQFIGAVPRSRLIQEQLAAQIHLYPFTGQTEELFCVSIAESQVAGVLPVASSDGALETTNMGVAIMDSVKDKRNYGLFVDKTVEYLSNPELPRVQKELSEKARERFGIERILKLWDEKVFNE